MSWLHIILVALISTCILFPNALSLVSLPDPNTRLHVLLQLPLSERAGIPHHLIDICDPSDEFSAGEFYDLARVAARDIVAVRGRKSSDTECGIEMSWLRMVMKQHDISWGACFMAMFQQLDA